MLNLNGLITVIICAIAALIGINERNGTYIRIRDGAPAEIKYIGILFLFWVLGLCIKDSYDIYWYQYAYERRIPHGKEPLFDFLQFFFHDHGFSFDTFKALWITVIAILLFTGIRKYGKKYTPVAALSLVSVFSSFVTQMRNAMVCAIVLNAFVLLFSGKKRDRVLYAIIVVACAQIHIIGYVFLIFLLIPTKEKRVYKARYYIAIAATTVFVIGFNQFFHSSLSGIISHMQFLGVRNMERIAASIDGIGTPLKAAIFLVFKHVVYYTLTDRACRLLIEERVGDSDSINSLQVMDKMNVLFLIFMPISIINASFERIYIPFYAIQYSLILEAGKYRAGLFNKFTLELSMKTFLVLIVLFILFVGLHSNPDDYVRILNSVSF